MTRIRILLLAFAFVALTGCSGLFGGGGGGDDTNSASLSESCAADATLDECVAACDEDSSLEWCDDGEVDCDANPLAEGCEGEDQDDDGIADEDDNCVDVANEDQEDEDDDGVGDACDDSTTTEVSLAIVDGDGDVITDKTYKDENVDAAITKTFTVTGATGAVVWKVSNLPEDAKSATDGEKLTISWTPANSGTFDFSIAASDNGSGKTKKADITFKVHEQVSFQIGVLEGELFTPFTDTQLGSLQTIGTYDQQLAISLVNRDVEGDYTFKISGKGYKVEESKPCKAGNIGCQAVILPKADYLNQELGEATITVENGVGDEAEITLAGVEFKTLSIPINIQRVDIPKLELSPCLKELTISNNGKLPTQLSDVFPGSDDDDGIGVVKKYTAEGGVGPFTWNVIAHAHSNTTGTEATHVEGSDEIAYGNGLSWDFDSTRGEGVVQYTRPEDTFVDRWAVECISDDEGSCRAISVMGTFDYPGIYSLLGIEFGEKEDVSFAKLAKKFPKGMSFKEQIFVRVTDEGCEAEQKNPSQGLLGSSASITTRAYYDEPELEVKVPKPTDEVVEGAEVALKLKIWNTYRVEEKSQAKLDLVDTAGNALYTADWMDISFLCGETDHTRKWNWPDFSTLTGDGKLTEIDGLTVHLKHDKGSVQTLKYRISKFYIIGKFWAYYEDDDDNLFTCGDGNATDRNMPILANKKAKGKWYLRAESTKRNSSGKDSKPYYQTWADDFVPMFKDHETSECGS